MSNKTAKHNSILTTFQKKNCIRHYTHMFLKREQQATGSLASWLWFCSSISTLGRLSPHPQVTNRSIFLSWFSPDSAHLKFAIYMILLFFLVQFLIVLNFPPALSVAVWYLHLPHSEFPCSYSGLVSRRTFCFILYQFYWAFPGFLGDSLNLPSSVGTACQVHWITVLLFM